MRRDGNFAVSLPPAAALAAVIGLLACGQQPHKVPRVFLSAVQSRDFQTVVDLTAFWQDEIADIKARNPKALWEEAVGAYRKGKITALSESKPGYWREYGEALRGLMGDPIGDIRGLSRLLPGSARWTINEARANGSRIICYVAIDYPDISEAPVAGSQLLRRTIVELVCDSRGLFVSARQLQDGNAFWAGGAELSAAIAKRFLQLGQLDVAVAHLEPLRANGKLSTEGASVLAAAYCQRVMNQCAPEERCKADVRGALALEPGLKMQLMNWFLSRAGEKLGAGEDLTALYYVRIASVFISGEVDLEARAQNLKDAAADRFVKRAERRMREYNHPFLTVAPELLEPAVGLSEVARRKVGQMAAAYLSRSLAGGRVYTSDFQVLEWCKKVGVRFPSASVSELLKLGHRIPEHEPAVLDMWGKVNLRAEWEKRVREVGSQ